MIWVYAICPRQGGPHPPVRGRGQAPLESIAHGGLVAVVSRAASGDEEATVDALHAHARVVDALMDEATVLPVRFGTGFAEPLAVRSALAVRRRPLLAALRRVDGCVEIAVRASVPGRRDATADPRARLRDRRLAAALHEPLAAFAVATRAWPTLVRGEVLRAAYLVPRREVPAFCAATAAIDHEYPQVDLTCTGPWPAYSFVDDGVEDERRRPT